MFFNWVTQHSTINYLLRIPRNAHFSERMETLNLSITILNQVCFLSLRSVTWLARIEDIKHHYYWAEGMDGSMVQVHADQVWGLEFRFPGPCKWLLVRSSIGNFSLRGQKRNLQSKLASKASRIIKLWVLLRDLASMNKVRKDQLRMTLDINLGPPHARAYTHTRAHTRVLICM